MYGGQIWSMYDRALVGGGARGAEAPPTFWEMKYFLPQKTYDIIETKSRRYFPTYIEMFSSCLHFIFRPFDSLKQVDLLKIPLPLFENCDF